MNVFCAGSYRDARLTDLPALLSPPASSTVLSLSTVAVKPEVPAASPPGKVVKLLEERLKISALVSAAPELPVPPTISACPFGSIAAA